MRALLPAVVIATLTTACASANVMRLDSDIRPAISPDSVVFLLDEPKQPYKAIGLVEVSDDGWGLGLETLKKRLGVEAAKMGAHAVIIGRQSQTAGAVFYPVGTTLMQTNVEESKLVGKAIVFLPR